ncbi:hypothetical protein PMAYCL1PPCAC_21313, partial [Pristionchus mayeri]
MSSTDNHANPATSIEIGTEECEVLGCVRRLEQRECLFQTYFFDGEKIDNLPERILADINKYVDEIFSIQDLRSRKRDLAIVAVHAVYCSKELTRNECPTGLIGDLLICYILRFKEGEIVDLLQREFNHGDELSNLIMSTDYTKSNANSPYSFRYLLDIAMFAKCEKLLNHSVSRRFAHERWTPRISIKRYHFLFAYFTIIPIWFIKFRQPPLDNDYIPSECTALSNRSLETDTGLTKWAKLRIFYSSPCSNFFVHNVFYFIYIFLYAAVLIRKPRYNYEDLAQFNDFRLSIALYIWQAAYIVEFSILHS